MFRDSTKEIIPDPQPPPSATAEERAEARKKSRFPLENRPTIEAFLAPVNRLLSSLPLDTDGKPLQVDFQGLSDIMEGLTLRRILPTPFRVVQEIKRQLSGGRLPPGPQTRTGLGFSFISSAVAAEAADLNDFQRDIADFEPDSSESATDVATRFIARAEKFVATAGPAGEGDRPTNGFGGSIGVKEGDTITLGQARKDLVVKVEKAKADVARLVTVPLTRNQEAALISLIFNVGASAFAGSAALKALNKNDLIKFRFEAYDAAKGFVKVKKGGKVILGLVNRRKAEERLFFREA